MRGILLVLPCAIFLAVAQTQAQTTPTPRTVKLIAFAANAPEPVMKYPLLPEVRDLRAGNAAIFYHRAHSPEWYAPFARQLNDYPMFHEWSEQPLSKLPLDKFEPWLNYMMVKELDIAARMEHCDWQILERIRLEGPYMLVPDLQSFRTLASLLALRGRVEARDGKVEKAVATVQTGFAMSRHLGEAPLLLNFLVSVVVAQESLAVVEELIQQPGAPNLYWALTDLPRPLLDLRNSLQGERVITSKVFPGIRQALDDPKALPLSREQINAGIVSFTGMGSGVSRGEIAFKAAQIHPRATQFFLKQGRTREDLDALPVTQLAWMYWLAEHDRWSDEWQKLRNLPYWEARTYFKKLVVQREAARTERGEAINFLLPLYGSPDKVFLAQARLQRRIDLLRCVEALRMYAAANDGQLPASLEEVRTVPIPIDPVTGKAFDFRREGPTAILSAGPPPEGELDPGNSIRYELTIGLRKARNEP